MGESLTPQRLPGRRFHAPEVVGSVPAKFGAPLVRCQVLSDGLLQQLSCKSVSTPVTRAWLTRFSFIGVTLLLPDFGLGTKTDSRVTGPYFGLRKKCFVILVSTLSWKMWALMASRLTQCVFLAWHTFGKCYHRYSRFCKANVCASAPSYLTAPVHLDPRLFTGLVFMLTDWSLCCREN